MRIAIAQINPVIGDFSYNTECINDYIAKAKALACDLVVFTELTISGYPPRDFLEKKDFVKTNIAYLNKLVESIRGIGVVCGYVDFNPADGGNPLFNSAVLFEDGKILQKANKRLLPAYDIFDERRYFEPGSDYSVFSYKGRRIGLTVCEDVWNDIDFFQQHIYNIDPLPLIVENGADLIINISASPYFAG